LEAADSADFDLAAVGNLHSARRRRYRGLFCAAAGCGVAVFAVLATLLVTLSSFRWTLAALWVAGLVGCLPVYLLLLVGSQAFRYLAPPPSAISISTQGLEFRFPKRRRMSVDWPVSRPGLELTSRRPDLSRPHETECRLYLHRREDIIRFWRRILPDSYLTEEAFDSLLRFASAAGCGIERSTAALQSGGRAVGIYEWYGVTGPTSMGRRRGART
jgi:hypothetical protein